MREEDSTAGAQHVRGSPIEGTRASESAGTIIGGLSDMRSFSVF